MACLAKMGPFRWVTISAVKMAFFSVLRRKEKGYLYGGTEQNRCIQTGHNTGMVNPSNRNGEPPPETPELEGSYLLGWCNDGKCYATLRHRMTKGALSIFQ